MQGPSGTAFSGQERQHGQAVAIWSPRSQCLLDLARRPDRKLVEHPAKHVAAVADRTAGQEALAIQPVVPESLRWLGRGLAAQYPERAGCADGQRRPSRTDASGPEVAERPVARRGK